MEKKFLLGFLVFVVLALSVVLVQQAGQQTAKVVLPVVPAETLTVNFGVVLPLTGAQANYGQGIREGLDLALNEINSENSSIKLRLVYEDTASDTKNAVTAAEKLLANDNVVAIISGPSQYPVAIAPLAEKNKIVLFTMASHSSKLNSSGAFVFKNDDTFVNLCQQFAPFVFGKGHRNVAILFASYNDATLEAKDSFKQKFESLGGNIVAVEGFDKGTIDFKTQIEKIKASNPDAVFLAPMTNDSIIILKQLRELGYQGAIFSNPGVEDPSVVKGAGNSAEGVIFATFNGVPSNAFVAKVQAVYGHAPLRWTTEAVDGLHLLANALNSIPDNNVSSIALQQALSQVKQYSGESGTAIFDANGNAHRQMFIKKIKNGKFVKLE